MKNIKDSRLMWLINLISASILLNVVSVANGSERLSQDDIVRNPSFDNIPLDSMGVARGTLAGLAVEIQKHPEAGFMVREIGAEKGIPIVGDLPNLDSYFLTSLDTKACERDCFRYVYLNSSLGTKSPLLALRIDSLGNKSLNWVFNEGEPIIEGKVQVGVQKFAFSQTQTSSARILFCGCYKLMKGNDCVFQCNQTVLEDPEDGSLPSTRTESFTHTSCTSLPAKCDLYKPPKPRVVPEFEEN